MARKWRLALLLPLLLSACSGPNDSGVPLSYSTEPSPSARPTITLGIHPLHNPAKLFELYGPIVDDLNHAIPEVRIQLEASRDYSEFENKLKQRQLELALPNPYQTLIAREYGYSIFAKIKGDEDFRGIILVRKGASDSQDIRQLKNKTLSCPARTALAACMMPLLYLQENGLDTEHHLHVVEVGSQESSMLNLARGLVDAAATWPPPWRAFQKSHPELASQMEVRWETPQLPNNSLMARDDIAPELIGRIREHLAGLSTTPRGQALLAQAEIQGFEAADDNAYIAVREFVERYKAQLGALPK